MVIAYPIPRCIFGLYVRAISVQSHRDHEPCITVLS